MEQEQSIPGYATPEAGLVKLLPSEGGCVPVSAAVNLLRGAMGPEELTTQIRRGNVIGYREGGADYQVPVWQFSESGRLLPGLPQVLERIREKIPTAGMIEPFVILLQAHSLSYGERPIHLLRRGETARVLEVVDAYAAQ